jgi:hypothetical protein
VNKHECMENKKEGDRDVLGREKYAFRRENDKYFEKKSLRMLMGQVFWDEGSKNLVFKNWIRN